MLLASDANGCPGFETLSKAEIKKDCKEIEKANSSMVSMEEVYGVISH